ncbi:MAG: CRISPR-associated endoribonuclease Cas6 [Clostridiales bacterium GWD2_32_59]|nr:MAG: CRISPR-associated endoribonuclease Cas6 [Clostridiales bacterium GWD2_32_59]
MRFALEFELEKNELPVDYRSAFISFLKNIFEKYDNDFYKRLYSKEELKQKPYTFAIFMKNAKFEKDKILLQGNKIIFNFSTYLYEYGIYFYNSALKFMNNSYPLANGNNMKLINIVLQKEKVISQNVLVAKTLAPIVVRDHNEETNRDTYILWNEENFVEKLKEDIKSNYIKFTDARNADEQVNNLVIQPVNMKKTVVFHQQEKLKKGIEASLGVLRLEGDIELLDYLMKAGIGSRRSQGFGMMEVIG